jgi:hypothetical protein
MTRTLDELKLDGLAAGLPMEWVHELLGCQWGRDIGTPDDSEPCFEQTLRMVCLHDPHGGRPPQVLKLCLAHADRLNQETNPHKETA